jgi:exodeoxyribonuclease VII large subunit
MNERCTVSEISAIVQALVEEHLQRVTVVGEVSNFKIHSSGHRYFTLKDSSAQISCVMWRTRTMGFVPEDGMRVVVFGNVTVFPGQGRYQIDCVSIKADGVGALFIAYEQLKQKMLALGFFDAKHKMTLPGLPMRIGIATSATGAALQDMLTTLQRRLPIATVVFRATLVQGERAVPDIVQALEQLESANCDVIILGRGGGSIEDLWCFNSELVVRAIAKCSIPVVSAVGHETDTTLADLVADVRAATPTAAAELVTATTSQHIVQHVTSTMQIIEQKLRHRVFAAQSMVDAFEGGQMLRLIRSIVDHTNKWVRATETALHQTLRQRLATLSNAVHHQVELLRAHHPDVPLQKGYAIIEQDGIPILNTTRIVEGDVLTVRTQYQRLHAHVTAATELDPYGT